MVGRVTATAGSMRGRGGRRAAVTRVVSLAQALDRADASRVPLPLPGSLDDLDEEDAYDAQERFVALRRARTGEGMAGYKVSMTSQETRALAGAGEPAFGRLTTGMVLRSPATLSLGGTFEPGSSRRSSSSCRRT